MIAKPSANGTSQRASRARGACSRRGRRARRASQGAIRSAWRKRPPAMIATIAASNGQRVSRMSSLRMFWTVLKPISGSNRPNAMRPVIVAWRSARTTSTREANGDASCAISHLLHVRPAEDALRQEDHGDGEDGEGGDILVVGREIRRPHGLDETDQQATDHGARERADASQHRGGERLDARHEAVGEAQDRKSTRLNSSHVAISYA